MNPALCIVNFLRTLRERGHEDSSGDAATGNRPLSQIPRRARYVPATCPPSGTSNECRRTGTTDPSVLKMRRAYPYSHTGGASDHASASGTSAAASGSTLEQADATTHHRLSTSNTTAQQRRENGETQAGANYMKRGRRGVRQATA